MSDALQTELLSPDGAVRSADLRTAPNGLHFALLGDLADAPATPEDLQRLVAAVPPALVPALKRHVYAFVPLALTGGTGKPGDTAGPDSTLIALRHHAALAERAICHRNATVDGREVVFLSSRLHNDRFALAFEFCINVAHNFVDTAGTPASFFDLVTAQAQRQVRGETSVDAWEHRAAAFGRPATEPDARRRGTPPLASAAASAAKVDERASTAFGAAAFADALAIYMLSLFLDVDYADLREREYPLLAPAALAERLRAIHALFPPSPGFEFQIRYRRRD